MRSTVPSPAAAHGTAPSAERVRAPRTLYGLRILEVTEGADAHILLDGLCPGHISDDERRRHAQLMRCTYQGKRLSISSFYCESCVQAVKEAA